MANHISHSLPFPVKHARYTLDVLHKSGDTPTDPTSPDTEFSTDGAAFTDCAEELTTVTGSVGAGYLTLSGAEMDGALVLVAAKGTGVDTLVQAIRPMNLPVILSGTASAGAAGSITLASGPATDDLLNGAVVRTTGGTGGGGTGGANNQARVISDWNGTTKVASVSPNWETTPSSDTTYDVLLSPWAGNNPTAASLNIAHSGTAQAGAASTITLAAGASAVNDFHNNALIKLTGGTGAGQRRFITDYDGGTKVATVDAAWATQPDSTTTYEIP